MRCFIASNHLIIVHSAPPYRHQRRNSELVCLWIRLYFDLGHEMWSLQALLSHWDVIMIQESRLSHAGFLWNINGPNDTFITNHVGFRLSKIFKQDSIGGPSACRLFIFLVFCGNDVWVMTSTGINSVWHFLLFWWNRMKKSDAQKQKQSSLPSLTKHERNTTLNKMCIFG